METIIETNLSLHPYNYSKYDFITENSIDITEYWIQYAEKNINRALFQIELSNILLNIDLALQIELSILEYSLIYCQNNKFDINFIKPIYEDKYYSIINNIKIIKGIDNYTFKEDLINGRINAKYTAFMSPSQMHPEKYAHILKKIKYIEHKENNINYSDAYKCFKCGESKCKITQAQTRSADEPMTTFVVCIVCNNTFKFC
jgi:DNA-directed RNA polymerase subunit M/transcription elongation factor TFIIS